MKKIFIICCIIGSALLSWSIFIEPNMLEVSTYKISSAQLKGLKVVFISDFHIAKNQEKRLQEIIIKANEQNPDVVLLGGDFVKGHKEETTLPMEIIANNLSKLESKCGTYAILGNHDWRINGQKMADALRNNSIYVLENDSESLLCNGKSFDISGLADPVTQKPDIEKSLEKCQHPTILLTHSPDIFPKVPNYVELTLAGHTHGGQVVMPFYGALWTSSKYGRRYAEGYVEDGGKKMIVTKGIGTSILPIRFNCMPEIVVIEFL